MPMHKESRSSRVWARQPIKRNIISLFCKYVLWYIVLNAIGRGGTREMHMKLRWHKMGCFLSGCRNEVMGFSWQATCTPTTPISSSWSRRRRVLDVWFFITSHNYRQFLVIDFTEGCHRTLVNIPIIFYIITNIIGTRRCFFYWSETDENKPNQQKINCFHRWSGEISRVFLLALMKKI